MAKIKFGQFSQPEQKLKRIVVGMEGRSLRAIYII